MQSLRVEIVESLRLQVAGGDTRTKKLFYKQKEFMEKFSDYPSLVKKKFHNVFDKYGSSLFEIRLDIKRQIVFVERGPDKVVWLKICNHDELTKKELICVHDDY
ncbi:MAG TPA: hypothetical protein VJB99_01345 [Patescibacteria group bacterium]|nr:hypothetical protein [Patescibacteria group bacterium]